MSGNDVVIISCLLILCTSGVILAKEYGKYKTKLMQLLEARKIKEIEVKKDQEDKELQAEKDEKHIKTLNNAINRMIDIVEKRDMEAPTRKLISNLEKEDVIKLPGKEPLLQSEAKSLYPKKPQEKLRFGHFDGIYTITEINVGKSPIEFKLKKDIIDFWAKAELSEKDIEVISKNIEDAWKKREPFEIEVRLFLNYNKQKITSATIQSTGDARNDAEDIQTIFDYWAKK